MSYIKYTDEQREMVMSLAKKKKSSRQISEATGVTIPSVKYLLASARKAKKLEYNKKYYKELTQQTPEPLPVMSKIKHDLKYEDAVTKDGNSWTISMWHCFKYRGIWTA